MFATRSSKTKKNKRKRVADDEEDGTKKRGADGAAVSDDEDDQLVAPIVTDRRKINTFSTGAGKKAKNVVQVRQIESEREIVPQKYAGDATYETQIDTEKDRDARAIMERNIKRNEDGSADQESGKVYKGQAGYKNYISKNESQIGMNKYTGTQGPIRAQTWARAISRFDYQPDICKDYKETGFCGYGDSCKFLHDRGDYKSGWQIEKEWAEKEKKRQLKLQQGRNPDEDDDEDDDKYVIHSDDEEQFACTICRGPFHNAVETINYCPR
uniref:C3H1-type domain-containing protein n=1 Tax=Globisporangium ultimum (strain ATCC 200006 / CBS 805.95 / DAOM BR144) TaxID=431595 RepID=K3WRV5_GLOUD